MFSPLPHFSSDLDNKKEKKTCNSFSDSPVTSNDNDNDNNK